MRRRAACTIVSANYFAFARTVAESFLAQHPDETFVVLIVDCHCEAIDQVAKEAAFRVIYVEELPISDFRSIAFKYDILELNTNVKPTLLKTLLNSGFES